MSWPASGFPADPSQAQPSPDIPNPGGMTPAQLEQIQADVFQEILQEQELDMQQQNQLPQSQQPGHQQSQSQHQTSQGQQNHNAYTTQSQSLLQQYQHIQQSQHPMDDPRSQQRRNFENLMQQQRLQQYISEYRQQNYDWSSPSPSPQLLSPHAFLPNYSTNYGVFAPYSQIPYSQATYGHHVSMSLVPTTQGTNSHGAENGMSCLHLQHNVIRKLADLFAGTSQPISLAHGPSHTDISPNKNGNNNDLRGNELGNSTTTIGQSQLPYGTPVNNMPSELAVNLANPMNNGFKNYLTACAYPQYGANAGHLGGLTARGRPAILLGQPPSHGQTQNSSSLLITPTTSADPPATAFAAIPAARRRRQFSGQSNPQLSARQTHAEQANGQAHHQQLVSQSSSQQPGGQSGPRQSPDQSYPRRSEDQNQPRKKKPSVKQASAKPPPKKANAKGGQVKKQTQPTQRRPRKKKIETFTLTGQTLSRLDPTGQETLFHICSDGQRRNLLGEALNAALQRTTDPDALAALSNSASSVSAPVVSTPIISAPSVSVPFNMHDAASTKATVMARADTPPDIPLSPAGISGGTTRAVSAMTIPNGLDMGNNATTEITPENALTKAVIGKRKDATDSHDERTSTKRIKPSLSRIIGSKQGESSQNRHTSLPGMKAEVTQGPTPVSLSPDSVEKNSPLSREEVNELFGESPVLAAASSPDALSVDNAKAPSRENAAEAPKSAPALLAFAPEDELSQGQFEPFTQHELEDLLGDATIAPFTMEASTQGMWARFEEGPESQDWPLSAEQVEEFFGTRHASSAPVSTEAEDENKLLLLSSAENRSELRSAKSTSSRTAVSAATGEDQSWFDGEMDLVGEASVRVDEAGSTRNEFIASTEDINKDGAIDLGDLGDAEMRVLHDLGPWLATSSH
jgi:hypothetical protein